MYCFISRFCVSIFVLAVLTACSNSLVISGGGSNSQVTLPSPNGTVTARQWEHGETIQVGNYMLENNEWNKSAATGPYAQSVFTETLNGNPCIGWNWNWQGVPAQTEVAYPEVGYGYSPWMGSWGTSGFTAKQISALTTCNATFNVNTSFTGSYCLELEMWATSTGSSPASAQITYQIIVYLNSNGLNLTGPGLITGDVIDTVNYNVYTYPDSGTPHYQHVNYVMNSPISYGTLMTLNLLHILQDAVNRSLITGNPYISSIELGNGVDGGTGLTEILNYSITYN